MRSFREDIDIGADEVRQHYEDLKLLEKAFEAAKEACDACPLAIRGVQVPAHAHGSDERHGERVA